MARGKRRVNPADYFPAKPRADGRYQKKIRGRFHYFGGAGVLRDRALAEYQRLRHRLYAEEPAVTPDLAPVDDYATWPLRDAANHYLDERREEIAAGTLQKTSYIDTRSCVYQFIHYVGSQRIVNELDASTFTAAANYFRGAISGWRYNHVIAIVNAWLNYAVAHGWLQRLPVFGPRWKKIPLSHLPKRERIVTPDEFGRLLAQAKDQMRAMLLLALNGGIGPTDLAALKLADIQDGIIRNRRSKTEIRRIVPLWPETLAAIEDWMTARIADRPEVFITKQGRAWDATDIGHEFTDLRRRAGFDMKERWGIYALRHTFATVADEHGDTNARRLVMGQKFPGIDAVYVHGKTIARLTEVVNLVRQHFLASLSRLPGSALAGSSPRVSVRQRKTSARAALPAKPSPLRR